MKRIALVALGAAMMATPVVAQTSTMAMAETASTPAQYVKMAGASDLYERQSSQLMLTSTNPKVRSFAQTMIKHHMKSTADVTAAAARSGLRPGKPMLNAEQAGMVAKLRAARGADRDQLYLEQQKMAHEKALALNSGYASDGTAAPLKAAAAKIAPVVQSHIDMLNAM